MPHTATAMRTPSRCAHRPPGTSSKRWPVWGGWTDSVDSPMGGPARPCVIEAAPGFCAGAGFDGIAPGIFMSAALHGAKVMVDEKGTEAAAATAMEFPSSEPPQADLTIVAATIRNRLLTVPGRLVNHSGRHRLRLPLNWPWTNTFTTALGHIRDLPLLI